MMWLLGRCVAVQHLESHKPVQQSHLHAEQPACMNTPMLTDFESLKFYDFVVLQLQAKALFRQVWGCGDTVCEKWFQQGCR